MPRCRLGSDGNERIQEEMSEYTQQKECNCHSPEAAENTRFRGQASAVMTINLMGLRNQAENAVTHSFSDRTESHQNECRNDV